MENEHIIPIPDACPSQGLGARTLVNTSQNPPGSRYSTANRFSIMNKLVASLFIMQSFFLNAVRILACCFGNRHAIALTVKSENKEVSDA